MASKAMLGGKKGRGRGGPNHKRLQRPTAGPGTFAKGPTHPTTPISRDTTGEQTRYSKPTGETPVFRPGTVTTGITPPPPGAPRASGTPGARTPRNHGAAVSAVARSGAGGKAVSAIAKSNIGKASKPMKAPKGITGTGGAKGRGRPGGQAAPTAHMAAKSSRAKADMTSAIASKKSKRY